MSDKSQASNKTVPPELVGATTMIGDAYQTIDAEISPGDNEIRYAITPPRRRLLANEQKNLEEMKRILEQIAAGDLSIESLPTEIRELMRTVQTRKESPK